MMEPSAHRYVGIDIGSATVKGVALDKVGTLRHHHLVPVSGDYQRDIAAVSEALGGFTALATVVATGYGQDLVGADVRTLSEISCHARGINWLKPSIELVIDIGGQDLKAIVVDAQGRPRKFLMNDKCAAGTGRFLDVMARALGVPVANLAELADKATAPARINSMCTVFAESEVISLLARGAAKADVAQGLLTAIAERVCALAGRLDRTRRVALTGGGALNRGLVAAVAHRLDREVVVPELPQLVGALGAALTARQV